MKSFDRIILASGSPRRRELLEQIGAEFEVRVSDVEENTSASAPDEVVCDLSRQKAMAVYELLKSDADNEQDDIESFGNISETLVIGADTVVSIQGQILGKPEDAEDAMRMIELLQGTEHSVYTGVTLVINGKCHTFSEKTQVYVYPMNKTQIRRYIDTHEPMDKAGAYGIQGLFAAYVKGINGDYNNVVGLPVGRICEELRGLGYEI